MQTVKLRKWKQISLPFQFFHIFLDNGFAELSIFCGVREELLELLQ